MQFVRVGSAPNPFRGIGAWRNSTEIQQSDHAPRSGQEITKINNSTWHVEKLKFWS